MGFERGENISGEKGPFLDVFNTVHEFVSAFEKKGISVLHTLPIKANSHREVVAAMGSDGRVYLLDQAQGKVMFIQTAKNWDAAVMIAGAYLERN